MTALRLRPEGLRVDWKVIAGFAVMLYVLRSALRSWNFRPDVLDLVAFGGLALILIARPLIARFLGETDERDE